jgi:hypothetical protein
MLHVWLIPALILLALIFFAFYGLMNVRGGTGVRTEGKTLMHMPDDDDAPPA